MLTQQMSVKDERDLQGREKKPRDASEDIVRPQIERRLDTGGQVHKHRCGPQKVDPT